MSSDLHGRKSIMIELTEEEHVALTKALLASGKKVPCPGCERLTDSLQRARNEHDHLMRQYEELRTLIDDGDENMTHKDAVIYLKAVLDWCAGVPQQIDWESAWELLEELGYLRSELARLKPEDGLGGK